MSDISQLNESQILLYTKIYQVISDTLFEFYMKNKDKTFSITLSGGYDSRFILYLCKSLNIPIKCCYTFCIENKLSTDLKLAKLVCEEEKVPLKVVTIPRNSSSIVKTMEILAKEYKCVKKTDFECTLPLYYLYKEINEDVILMGTDSDNYFALGRNYALHFKKFKDGLTRYKEYLWSNPNDGQIQQKAMFDYKYNKQMFDVFNTKSVYDVFKDTSWNELNIPYKKGPLYIAFKSKYDLIKPYRVSYQCGDSGIRELCEEILMSSKYNRGYKSVVGCYNEIVRSLVNDIHTTKLF